MTGSARRLSSIRSVDAHIFRGEIASPVVRRRSSSVQVDDDMDVFFQQTVAGGALVEIDRLAATQHGDAGHINVHATGFELDTGAAGSGEDAAPVRIASRE